MNIVARFWQPRLMLAVVLAVLGLLPQTAGLGVAALDATRHQDGSRGAARRTGTHASHPHFQLHQKVAVATPEAVLVAPRSKTAVWVQDVVFWSTVIMAVCVYVCAYAALWKAKFYPYTDRSVAYITVGDDDDEKDAEAGEDKDAAIPLQSASDSGSASQSTIRRTNTYLRTGHVTVSSDDLISEVGLSGMSVLPADATSGVSKMTNRHAVPLIAVQACALQVGMLHFLGTQLVPRAELHHRYHELPTSIVFIAIYLHFLNCTQELPYCWQLFQHLQDFHKDPSALFVMGSVLILDAFAVPLLSFCLGALYLCTSRTISDVILNAVAVAFVHEIDNWILALNTRASFVAGKVTGRVVHIPINRKAMRAFSWTMIFVPVVPIAVSAGMVFLGYKVLGL